MKMKRWLAVITAILTAAVCAAAQTSKTFTKTERFDFGAGGTVSVTGAPSGSIRIHAAEKSEIEINATVTIEGLSPADAARVAELTGFVTDGDPIRAAITTVGPHNKFGAGKLPKNFPKNLLATSFRIDYDIAVPRYADLEVDGGKGDLSISGVEGALKVNLIESKATIEVVGGAVTVNVGSGSVDIAFGTRGWRARTANVSVGTGDLNVTLPSTLSAELDVSVLRTGRVINNLPDLKPRDRKIPFTERSIAAKAGVGGPQLKFVVGDGTIKLDRLAARP